MTIGLMILAIVLSVVVLGIGLVFPPFLAEATSITQKFDFSELLVNVMLPFFAFCWSHQCQCTRITQRPGYHFVLGQFLAFYSQLCLLGLEFIGWFQQPFLD